VLFVVLLMLLFEIELLELELVLELFVVVLELFVMELKLEYIYNIIDCCIGT